MLDDMTQMIKEKLLEDLIEKMSEHPSELMKPKGLGVEVQAKDPGALKEGLDKAKELVGKGGEMPGEESGEHDEGDDEQRLMALLGDDDDEKEKGI